MKSLILIDANSLIHRCYHALPPFTNNKGEPTGALYGVANVMLKVFKERKPDYAGVFFDRPEETFRKQRDENYKANRVAAPDELISQIIKARALFKAFGVKTFELPGYEADDLIGTAVEKFKKEKVKTIILTGDLDATQLVDDENEVVVETFKKGISEMIIYDEKGVEEKFGVKAEQVIDYKGLVGDSSDNIKGVPGVGPKTAVGMLEEFGTVEEIYKNLKEDDKKFKKFVGFEKQAVDSKEMATIDTGVPIDLGKIESLDVSGFKEDKPLEFFKEMNFGSLIKRIEGGGGREQAQNKKVALRQAMPTGRQAQGKKYKDEEFVLSEEKRKPFDFTQGKIKVGPDATVGTRKEKVKVGFELKEKIKEGNLKPPYFDLGVAFWLLDPDVGNYSPGYVLRRFLKKGEGGLFDESQDEVSENDLKEAYEFVLEELEEKELMSVFEKIEMPLLPVLAEMEREGIKINSEKLKELRQRVKKEVRDLEKKIYKAVGEEFNINSPKQMGEILFKKLGISTKKIKKTAGGSLSTNYESLMKIKDEHEAIKFILKYREFFKILSTYIEPILELAEGDGKLHTTYLQTGTATGRLSSAHPNLQNIPQESELAEPLRECFEAGKGKRFLSFDYSQMELRILASVTQDKKMIKTFKEGGDIHRMTASNIFNIEPEEVGKSERRVAKILNFGIVYGMGPRAFGEAAGISQTEAKKFIEEYFSDFEAIKKWQETVRREARMLGYVKTLNERKRLVPEINSSSPRFAAQAERIAINMPIQGLAADVMKLAIIKSAEKIKEKKWEEKVKMILTIHDELVFEVEEEMSEKVKKEIGETMEGAFKLSVPLVADVKEGKSLGKMKS